MKVYAGECARQSDGRWTCYVVHRPEPQHTAANPEYGRCVVQVFGPDLAECRRRRDHVLRSLARLSAWKKQA